MNVKYDAQQDFYFKIDKETGQTIKSHRNGSDLVRFKPQYSGSDYKARKEMEKSLSPPSLTRPPFRVKLQHKHTESINLKNSQTKSQHKLKPLHPKPTGFGVESRTIDHCENNNDFSQKLKQFSFFKERLKNENHSPKREIEGSINKDEDMKGIIHFVDKMKDISLPIKKRKKMAKSLNVLTASEMPENLVLKNQIRKERQIFLKYNNRFANEGNERQENQLRDRKTNLRILQKLQLEKNDRVTKQVYS